MPLSTEATSRLLHGALLVLMALTITFTLGVGNASAIKLHTAPPEVFGPDGTPGTSFTWPISIAFQQATRRLYVYDDEDGANQDKIYGFDASTPSTHTPLAGFSPLLTTAGLHGTIAVDNSVLSSAGRVYRSTVGLYTGEPFPNENNGPPELFGFAPTGSSLSGWPIEFPGRRFPGGMAIDPTTGNLWVSDSEGVGQGIRRYTPSGTPLPSFSAQSLGQPNQIAFDSNGDLYAVMGGFGSPEGAPIYRFPAPTYEHPTMVVAESNAGSTIAVDGVTHDIYVSGPSSPSAILAYSPDGTLLEEFAAGISPRYGIAVDQSSGDVYASASGKVYRFPGVEFPLPTTGAASNPTDTSVTVNGTVRPDGMALTDCHFEYVTEAAFQATGFADLSSGGDAPCAPAFGSIPADAEKHPVSAALSGLDPATVYRFRLVAANANGPSYGQSATFQSGKPVLETTGSPLRSATTAHLEGRVYPHGVPTTYYFEYGDQGPCDASPCQSTEPHPAGAGGTFELASQAIGGLSPNTVYHYRVVADNGDASGLAVGEDMTVTTRASDAPLSHGHFPGPPGSDRAWEQVSIPDTGGNPVLGALAVSDNGDRAFYRVAGGTPISSTGTTFSPLYAERTPGGWRSSDIYPPRDQLVATSWSQPVGRNDLTDQVVPNFDNTTGAFALWRLRPGQPATKVYEPDVIEHGGPVLVSEDASRVVVRRHGSLDPDHPVVGSARNLYDVTSGTPHLIDLMPDGSVPPCGADGTGPSEIPGEGPSNLPRSSHWLSADGTLAFFPSKGSSCSGGAQLYMREIEAERTKLISTPPLSGLDCDAAFVKSNPEAVFFWTQARLSSEDTDPASCSGSADGDVYRYDLVGETLRCVTCVVPNFDADVQIGGNQPRTDIAIAEDGSRLYFSSAKALLPGAAAPGVYRVDVASGGLAYVAPLSHVGENVTLGQAITPDGAAIVFVSNSAALNPLGGQQNGGTNQFYRYDDRDRSLTCLSCPLDGSAPTAPINPIFFSEGGGLGLDAPEAGANRTALSADGQTFAFATSTALVPADQNAARPGQSQEVGKDVYEWRDGRQLLVSDGLTSWAGTETPSVTAITPSGHDIFLTAAAQYTPDALDGYRRLYDARIGGGIEFPSAPQPCPLEVCQGTPKGTPEEPPPGSGSFAGPGNEKARVHHKKKKKQHHRKQRAKHNRGGAR